MSGQRIDAALIHEAVRVQRDKTLLQVRDLIEQIPIEDYDQRAYSNKPRTAQKFRSDLLTAVRALGEDS